MANWGMSRSRNTTTALLLIDVINDFDFPEAKKLYRHALPAARRIAALKKRCRNKDIPTIYVNDNFGRWRSDFKAQVTRCLEGSQMSSSIARLLRPDEKDYFVLKPKHSAFFQTSLPVLLESLGVRRVIITGFATDICVLFTANDAYMRDYEVSVPPPCTAAESDTAKRRALEHMKRFLKAETTLRL
jgi:nicotinamidase-related amidase